jgi:hypothetical protein
MSAYNESCFARAIASIKDGRANGEEPNALEISSDVWAMIQMGGFNIVDKPVFAGLPVVEVFDATDHIQAIVQR